MILRDLVALFAPRARVLTGHALLDRPVRWVHATDLMDPSPYLKPGELVLTNGIWRRRPADSSRFVGVLTRARAAALGFGLRSESARTPADLIEACDREALPLIEIPHDMPFTALSEAVASFFADQRQGDLIRALRRDQARREIQQRFASELLDLLEGGEAKLTEVATRLRSLGVDPRLPMTVLAIAPQEAQAVALGSLSEAAERFFASQGHPVCAPQTRGRVVVIVSVKSDREALELANGLHTEFRQEGWDALVGVGGVCQTGIARLQRSLVQAEHALDLALAGGGAGPVTTFTEIGSYAMLFALQDAESKRSFVSALLGALIERDGRHNTQLVHTLDVYLSAGANWQRAADQLHVHVNTLRYRVSQIERITGRDLSSVDDRVSFYIALRGAATLQPSS